MIAKKLFSCIILFMSVYQVNVPIFINSTLLSGFICFVFVLFLNKANTLSYYSKLLNYKVIFLLLIPFCIYLLAGVFSLSLGNADQSFIKQPFVIFIMYISIVNVSVCLKLLGLNTSHIYNAIVFVVTLQALIIISALYVPSVLDFVRLFQPQDLIIRSQNEYLNARGLTVSGPAFFGLSSAMSLILFLLSVYEYNTKNRVFMYVYFIFITIPFFTSGRVVMLWMLGFVFYLSLVCNKRSIKLLLLIFLVICFSMMSVLQLIDHTDGTINVALNRGFEVLINIYNGDGIQSNSTDGLIAMFNKLKFDDLIFGSFTYLNEDNSYYGGVDIGYYRNFYLFGIVGFIILFFYQVLFLLIGVQRKYINVILSMIFMMSLLQLKGEVMFFAFPFQSVVFFSIVFHQLYKYRVFDSEKIKVCNFTKAH